jgi:hypothetical protein
MIPDGAIGLLIGFMIGSISGVFCFALVVGASRYEDGEYLEDEDEESDNDIR